MRNSFLALCMFFCLHAQAATIEKPLPDMQQENQARAIFQQLRCVVCEGQSLAESDAALAVQMRQHIRELLAQGQTPTQIYATFRDSYGDRVFMTPPVNDRTYLLWGAPLFLLAIGGVLLRRATKETAHG